MAQKSPDGRIKKFLSANSELIGWVVFGVLIISIYQFSSRFGVMLLNGEFAELYNKLLPSLQDFITLTLSVIVEAVPFLILGIIISALIRYFLSSKDVFKMLPKTPFFDELHSL